MRDERRKKEASKGKQTNKAKQHSMYMYIHAYIVNIILHCVKLCQYHSVWQQKDLKTLKAHGQSKKKAVSTITVATPDL